MAELPQCRGRGAHCRPFHRPLAKEAVRAVAEEPRRRAVAAYSGLLERRGLCCPPAGRDVTAAPLVVTVSPQ